MTRNLTMMTDLYQLTMMYGYYKTGKHKQTAVFDIFFRQADTLTYAVSAGLEQAIDYIKNLRFEAEDIKYLRELNLFDEDFLSYLKDFSFTGDIYSVVEGSIVFPYEPILTVKAPVFEAQLVETALLNIINHQTLIATKAARITSVATKGSVVEFGLRRAQGPDAGIYGSRASIIGGCNGSSNVLACQMFGAVPKGTHAHSWVMAFPTELEAFEKFAEIYPDKCLLLVDTYNTLKSGVPNAIKVFDQLKAKGHKPIGIRLDSGDLAYLSKKARKMLDESGHSDAIIFASGDIDEYLISTLNDQGAKIDVYGVGTKLITSESNPSLGGVYKMSAIERDGELIPKMKISDTVIKMTNPGFKQLYRIYDTDGKAFADYIALRDEKLTKPLTLTDPIERWKSTTLENYTYKEMLVPIFLSGKQVYFSPTLAEIAEFADGELDSLWEEYKRIINPHIYKVDLSDKLWTLKQDLLKDSLGGSR